VQSCPHDITAERRIDFIRAVLSLSSMYPGIYSEDDIRSSQPSIKGEVRQAVQDLLFDRSALFRTPRDPTLPHHLRSCLYRQGGLDCDGYRALVNLTFFDHFVEDMSITSVIPTCRGLTANREIVHLTNKPMHIMLLVDKDNARCKELAEGNPSRHPPTVLKENIVRQLDLVSAAAHGHGMIS
jgi:hypothetical protein